MVTQNPTAWERMRGGDIEGAIRQMEDEYRHAPDPSHTMSLGIGYLWIGDYQSAWKHVTRVN